MRRNLVFYVCQLAQTMHAVLLILSAAKPDTGEEGIQDADGDQDDPHSFIGRTSIAIVLITILVVTPFIWLALRAVSRHQVRVARNAQRVLKTMEAAAALAKDTTPAGQMDHLSMTIEEREAFREFFREATGRRRNRSQDNYYKLDELLASIPWLPCQ